MNRFMNLSDRYMDIAEDFAEALNDTDYEDLEAYFGDYVEKDFISIYDTISEFSQFLRDLATR